MKIKRINGINLSLQIPRKFCLLMKLYLAFTLALCMQVSATTFSQGVKVSLEVKNVSLEQLIKEIKSRSDMRFLYNHEEISEAKRLSLQLRDATVEEVMEQALMGLDLDFKKVDDVIVIQPTPGKGDRDRIQQAIQKQVEVKGFVKDDKKLPIPGVNVYEKSNPQNGVITGNDGSYRLVASSADAVLVFSFIGFDVQEATIGSRTVIDVVLKEELTGLDEVVVVGYGRKDKKSLTSSIASIDKDELERMSSTTSTVDNLLGGTIKGVLTTQNSGEPGAAPTISIRGITSPYPNTSTGQANNIPLFVIDGVPMFVESNALNPLLAISPNDIESIDVLKDAAATAIYGSRGANGVIIVVTKNGRQSEKIDVEAGYTFSIANAVKEFKPLNNSEFRELQDQILKNTVPAINEFRSYADGFMLDMMGQVDVDWDTWEFSYNGLREEAFGTANTNWNDEIKNKNAATHQYNLAIRGGTNTTTYAFSFNAINQEGLFKNDQLDRYGARLSLNSELTKQIKVGAVMNYSVSARKSASIQDFYESTKPWLIRPDVAVRDENGDFSRIDASLSYYGLPYYMANPVAQQERESDFKSNQFMGNAFAEVELLKNWKLRADISLSTFTFENSYFSPIVSQDIMFDMPLEASLDLSDSRSTRSSVNFRSDYNLDVNLHHFTGMVGGGFDRSFSDGKSFWFKGFPNDQHMSNPGSAKELVSFSDSNNKSGLNSIYSRLTYDFDHRYLVEASFRADESSKFGPNNRWGYFPALSLGWRINNEGFLRDITTIDDLKLRLSVGKTGSTNVSDFSYKQFFIRSSSDYYGGNLSVRLKDLLPNEGIRWEMTSEYNAGFDFSLWNNRLYGSVDAYYRYTDGALAPAPHSLESGLNNYYANIIDMSNRGFELQLGGDWLRNKNFTWNTTLNLATNKNRIEELNSASIGVYMQDAFIEGKPAGTLKGFKVVKIIQDQAEIDALNNSAYEKGYDYYQEFSTAAGDYLMEDTNGDGRVNNADRVVIANPEPDFFGGLSNTFAYKNLSLSFLMQFSVGGEILWENLMTDAAANLGVSVNREMFRNTWTPDNTDAKYAQMVNSSNAMYNMAVSDRYVFDASYLRMKNISLSYQLPKQLLSRMKISQMSVFASATNLFTFTNWPGLDPELVSSGLIGMSSNSDPYPLSKCFSVGVKINL